MIDLLPLVLLLPLAGAAASAGLGRVLSGSRTAIVATTSVALSFLLAIGIAGEYVTRVAPPGDEGSPAVVRTLWRWVGAGENLVQMTVALTDLAQLQPVPAEAVGTVWAPSDSPGMSSIVDSMWDPAKVVGQRPISGAVARYTPLTIYNVPPGDESFSAAAPRAQHAFAADVTLQLDGLSIIMLLVVTGVGLLIHLFAVGYMAGDPGTRRFFAYMNLFVFGMLLLVLAGDFLVLFVGWEMVGLCSYLLIGFWHADDANAEAGRKAFIVNRVGDFAFLVGLMLIWSVFGSLAYSRVLPAAEALLPSGSAIAIAIAALMLVGATGKSAQVPLFVWLPDAMAGPTPVSALIHAATMVTAGVYMIVRAHALFERAPQVMAAVAIIGTVTALMAALVALVQADIKRVLAYSTISQLGYMFVAVGAGAYIAGIFHLVTHAFFKALLFLAAGSLMHALQHGFRDAGAAPQRGGGIPPDQDLQQMGGLLARAPVTGWTLVVGALALAGLVPLAGFWSKDEILAGLLDRAHAEIGLWALLFVAGLLVAVITALYSARLLLLALAGAPRSAGARGAVESPLIMTAPLVALAVLSAVGGTAGVGLRGSAPIAALLEPVVGVHPPEPAAQWWFVALSSTVAVFIGLVLAWRFYGPRHSLDPARAIVRAPRLHRLLTDGFHVDALYRAAFVRPFERAADWLWLVVDDKAIDGAVNGAARGVARLARVLRRWQTGYTRTYLLSMLLGIAALAAWFAARAR